MENEALLNTKAGFLQPEISEILSNTSDSNSFGDVGKEKIESLKKSISELKELIQEREKLSKENLQEAEKIKTEVSNFLFENESSKFAELSEGDLLKEKNSLRHKKIEISESQLKEKIDCWKDIALLKKELRQYERELTEKESRLDELNKILKEN